MGPRADRGGDVGSARVPVVSHSPALRGCAAARAAAAATLAAAAVATTAIASDELLQPLRARKHLHML